MTVPWSDLSELYGFIGNSLLTPMLRTSDAGLDPRFWRAVPSFGDAAIDARVDAMERFAEAAQERCERGIDVVESVSVEFTRLFAGPPKPAAPPWETMYRGGSASVGFGEATVEMRKRLHEAGLVVSNEVRQYEDHLGLELLYLCEMCRRFACGSERSLSEREIFEFIERHPLSWIGRFRTAIEESAPDGYFDLLVAWADSVLVFHATACPGVDPHAT